MNTKFKFGGWKKSYTSVAPNFATVKASSAGNSLPDECYLRERTPISYQSFSDCVANSGCDALEILLGLQDPDKVIQLSRLFGYYNARAWEHTADQDSGCFIHDFYSGIKLLGTCREETWQYNQQHLYTKPSLIAYKEALDNQIPAAYEITSSGNQRVQDVCTAIANGHPVNFGTVICQDLMDYNGEDKVFYPHSAAQIGGHAILIVGYRTMNGKKQFIVRNSWSNSYGLACPTNEDLGLGHFWMSDSYLMDSDTSDLFVPTYIDNILFK